MIDQAAFNPNKKGDDTMNIIDQKNKLPNDLRKYVLRRALKRIISCMVLLLGFGVIMLLYGDVLFGELQNAFKVLIYIVIMILTFRITGVPHKLIDQTYCGKVIEVNQVLSMDNESSTKPSSGRTFTRNTIYLTIVTPDGKKITKKAHSGRVNLYHSEAYQMDDEVFHLAYTPRTIVLPQSSDTRVECCVCGRNNDIENDTCDGCGHTLVKVFVDF